MVYHVRKNFTPKQEQFMQPPNMLSEQVQHQLQQQAPAKESGKNAKFQAPRLLSTTEESINSSINMTNTTTYILLFLLLILLIVGGWFLYKKYKGSSSSSTYYYF